MAPTGDSSKSPTKKARKGKTTIQAPQFQNETNALRVAKTTSETMMYWVYTCFETLIQHPKFWTKPGMARFRQYVQTIANNPIKYPPTCNPDIDATINSSSGPPELTKGIAKGLQERSLEFRHGDSTGTSSTSSANPIVQIGTFSFRTKHQVTSFGLATNIKMCTARVIDGDKNSLLLKFDSMLGSALERDLAEGCVLELKSYQPMYFAFETTDPSNMALVVRSYRVVGRYQLPADYVTICEAPIKTVAEPPRERQSVGRRKKSNNDVNPPGDDPNDSMDETDDNSLLNCDGNYCSLYGVRFRRCVTELFPADSFILDEVASKCFFVTVEVKDMDNSMKRNILYYWYATNVYSICGSGNRQPLPKCLVQHVRNTYPSDDGKYTGFMDTVIDIETKDMN
jgi:hypothetical protein